jgi:chemosensory pili system protein ChpA (sensor histidine kinase/response regulator)
MLDQVRNHQKIESAKDIINQVEHAASGMPVDEDIDSTVDEQKQQEIAHPATSIYSSIANLARDWIYNLTDQSIYSRLRSEIAGSQTEAHATANADIQQSVSTLELFIQAVVDGHIIPGIDVNPLFLQMVDNLLLLDTNPDIGLDRTAIDEIVDLINQSKTDIETEQTAQISQQQLNDKIAAEAKVASEKDDKRRRASRVQHDMVRVRSDLLDQLSNNAGEVSIYRSRIEQQIGKLRLNLDEMNQTVVRLREQLRQFDIETEAQIGSKYLGASGGDDYSDFDPLEFDRFTTMQQLSRSMIESLSDLMSIESIMADLSRESETLLLQQSRVNTELHDSLIQTRMVPLVENAPRLRRVVRQVASELGKDAVLRFEGAEVEMDRHVAERMLAPLEHMLRNSVAHGLETPEERINAGKSESGTIIIAQSREGSEIVVRVSDDGKGIDLDAVRAKAIERGLLQNSVKMDDHELIQFILESGFSTATSLSQISGRGVGLDVVNSEIRQLGGSFEIASEQGQGTQFIIRIPLTLTVSRALLITANENIYAVPLMSIAGIEQITQQDMVEKFTQAEPVFSWVDGDYRLLHISTLLGYPFTNIRHDTSKHPVLLAQSGSNRVAIVIDGLIGSREVVVKPMGAQLSNLQLLSGATILADGSVALVLDVPSIIRQGISKHSVIEASPVEEVTVVKKPVVMVVDDSITVRKVTERLLKRNEIDCVTAKDGVDALAVLESVIPDVMLLDIEMPRMDGYELATHIRNSEIYKKIPIIMITSRTGEKHKQRAMDIGVDVYMGKPYSETELLDSINKQLTKQEM